MQCSRLSELRFSQGLADGGEIVNFIAVSESTPGAVRSQYCNLYRFCPRRGSRGSFCNARSCASVVLIILAIARCYKKFKSSKIVAGLMSGLKPAVIGLIAAAVLTVGKTVFLNSATPTGFPATASDWFRTVSSALIFCACTLCLPKKTSSDINDFDWPLLSA